MRSGFDEWGRGAGAEPALGEGKGCRRCLWTWGLEGVGCSGEDQNTPIDVSGWGFDSGREGSPCAEPVSPFRAARWVFLRLAHPG